MRKIRRVTVLSNHQLKTSCNCCDKVKNCVMVDVGQRWKWLCGKCRKSNRRKYGIRNKVLS